MDITITKKDWSKTVIELNEAGLNDTEISRIMTEIGVPLTLSSIGRLRTKEILELSFTNGTALEAVHYFYVIKARREQ